MGLWYYPSRKTHKQVGYVAVKFPELVCKMRAHRKNMRSRILRSSQRLTGTFRQSSSNLEIQPSRFRSGHGHRFQPTERETLESASRPGPERPFWTILSGRSLVCFLGALNKWLHSAGQPKASVPHLTPRLTPDKCPDLESLKIVAMDSGPDAM